MVLLDCPKARAPEGAWVFGVCAVRVVADVWALMVVSRETGRGHAPASEWTELTAEIKVLDQGRAAAGYEVGDKRGVHE